MTQCRILSMIKKRVPSFPPDSDVKGIANDLSDHLVSQDIRDKYEVSEWEKGLASFRNRLSILKA